MNQNMTINIRIDTDELEAQIQELLKNVTVPSTIRVDTKRSQYERRQFRIARQQERQELNFAVPSKAIEHNHID